MNRRVSMTQLLSKEVSHDLSDRIKVLLIGGHEMDYIKVHHDFSMAVKRKYEISWEKKYNNALGMVNKNQYHIYLLGYDQKIEQAWDFINRIESIGSKGPVILIGNSSKPKNIHETLRLGASDYLDKKTMNTALVENVVLYSLERKKREEQVLEQQKQFTGAVKMFSLGKMALNIAHEINNPLTVLIMRLEEMRQKLVRKVPDLAGALICVDKLEAMANKIEDIVGKIKYSSRDGSDDPFEKVYIKDIFSYVHEMCEPRFKVLDIKFTLDSVEDDCVCECRPTEISQVLLNLIHNSCDAIKDQSEKYIQVELKDLGKMLQISVRDSGTGVPKNIMKKIMNPFFTTKKMGEGTGLGLSICREIVRSHGGTLDLEDKCKNTCFSINIPKKQETKEDKKMYKVVVVDDEPEIRTMVAERFQDNGFSVFSAGDGLEAFEVVQANGIDLVITDYKMPKGNGAELVSRLKKLGRDNQPQVLMMTAFYGKELHAIEGESVTIFRKPFNMDDLVDTAKDFRSKLYALK